MLDLAKASREGQLYTCLSALVLSAFMLEAYLNHLGGLKHKDWDALERKQSKTKKFRTFAAQSGINVNLTERPYKSLVTLFAYRDSMAHGKTVTEEIDAEVDIDSSIAASIPSAEWQQFATLDTAEELLTDAVAIIRQLHAASGYHDDPFGSGGGGLYAVSHTDTDA
ncbi:MULTISPECIES: hypothetical protein [unclassified Burkholderia]|uniref:hypothetical protein n=1 Tax=unclassified Burkholderia TaxID=2613784 RepID=UPI002AB2F3C0|nr:MULTISPECIES: hypothetical protein [unclassified Burkholderia]